MSLDWTDQLPPWAPVLWAQTNTRIALVMVLVAGAITLLVRPQPKGRVDKQDKPVIRRKRNTALMRRLWWKARPPHDLMRVDGLAIDRTGKRSHALWPGPTGAGKSESVATVRCDGARPWLAVMPDVSDPLRRRADFIWTAGESAVPIDFLKGTPEDVAERLTTVFRSGGNGVWMMAAREAATQVIRGLDQVHEPRSLQTVGAGVEELVESNRRLKTACEGWVTRFLATAMAMGPSVAAGGVDIADLLRAGKGVVIDNDRWKHPGLCGDTVAFGLAEAKRIGDLVPGGFRLIFEEADQLGERIDLADPFFAAGRRRQIAVDALVHAEEDADDAMATNSATRVYFRPNKPEQRAKVAKALDLSEAEVDAIPDYHAWIEHDGKIRRLVHFPKPAKGVSVADTTMIQDDGYTKTDRRARGRVVPIERQRRVLLALPPPSRMSQKLRDGLVKDGTCLRWRKDLKHTKDGYGQIWIEKTAERDGYWDYVHILAYEETYGLLPRSPEGFRLLTIGHDDRCFRDCCNVSHLKPQTRSINSKDRWAAERNGVKHG